MFGLAREFVERLEREPERRPSASTYRAGNPRQVCRTELLVHG
jgi:hypothetical protein